MQRDHCPQNPPENPPENPKTHHDRHRAHCPTPCSIPAVLRLAACTVLLAVLPANLALAEQEGPILGFFKFTAGVISAYALHETGHAVAASVTDTKLDWGIGTYNQPLGFTEWAENDTAGRLVHASGLTTQIIVSEVILQADSIDKNDNFVRGMMTWNVLNPIIYALDYWFFRSTNVQEENYYQGDIEGLEHYSSEGAANLFAGTMAALAAFQGYRFLKTQHWAPRWALNEDIQLNYRPYGASGFALNIEMNF